MKEKFDKKFPEAKILREMELRKTSRQLFSKSLIGKATSIIYVIIALVSIFIYWKFFNVNIFLSVLFGIVTWFIATYVFDEILIKLLTIEKTVKKINDEEIEIAGKKLEESLKQKGVSIDDFLK